MSTTAVSPSAGLATDRATLAAWLACEDDVRLEDLWAAADAVRREHVGDDVHLRGLIEISNHCVRQCAYCGLAGSRAPEPAGPLPRYRMTHDEILACAHQARGYGYGTVVLQGGEDYGLTADWVAAVVRAIKAETGLSVTLSLGERREDELQAWRAAGADRYLLRFETANRDLYRRIHPDLGREVSDRLALLQRLRAIGYEIGTGIMAGIPGQTFADLLDDLETFRRLDPDMIGIGPYLPHPQTPLGREAIGIFADTPGQVPSSERMTCILVALTRLVCPEANLPATTALATINKRDGRENGLRRGANILMPNLTPVRYRALYEIYPAKACVDETAEQCHGCLDGRIRALGRVPGRGPGSRRRSLAGGGA